MEKVIFHMDLDAFYASVEVLDHPEYRGKPVIVGARPGTRGVVATCSYEARAFGVHSAMPISRAYSLCPNGIYVLPRMERYAQLSRSIMEELDHFSPVIRQMSIDEAFLDMTGTQRLFGPPLEAGARLKARLRELTGLSCSIGIGPNHYIAKLASGFRKPDGLFQVSPSEVIAFMDGLPLTKLHGAGSKTQERLKEIGIETTAQLRSFPLEMIQTMMGQASGLFLYNAVRGLESPHYDEPRKSHSVSTETTFEQDTKNSVLLAKVLLDMSHQLIFRIWEEGWRGKTISLKIRLSDFTTLSVQSTLKHWISSGEELFTQARSLLKKKWDGASPLRLLGLAMDNLEKNDSQGQSELFEDDFTKKRKVEEAVLRLKSQFPSQKIVKASLMKKDAEDGPEAGD